ncbi:hypothetical protein [Neolewinella antarctica]|uniref:CRISPR-associated protein Cas5 n=1 Tax=Neolewinella antarctica TaxID=442734 RepID=A0ABX0X8U9_9BACT|nr:hypothetical protein [Neolewinella antarctica]NJC25689.1 CRISPR-associated protein Cas5 [Neolewinella antarctica]
MKNIDLSFYLEPPELTVSGTITIDALAPLSMVESQPGAYFRTALKPPPMMVYGALENMLGWHLPLKDGEGNVSRNTVLKGLAKAAKRRHKKLEEYKGHPWLSGKPLISSKTGYFSLLQYHLTLEEANTPAEPLVYDDLWSMHLRDKGMNFTGGSRNYDGQLEAFITQLRTSASTFKKMTPAEAKLRSEEKYELGDRKGFERIELDKVYETNTRKVNPISFRSGYPMYYVSPKKRGFVVPNELYVMAFRTTPAVLSILEDAFQHNYAPTYLGSSEGWINLKISSDES